MAQPLPTQQTPEFQTDLANAIARGAVQACFKPIVDAQTRRVLSCEVIPCWHDSVHGHVLARNLMPVVQQLGLVDALWQQVWVHALACLQTWHQQSLGLTLLANISRQQFRTRDFTARMANDLVRLGIPLCCVDLEIAETVAIEEGMSALARLAALRDAGFGLVIGEFGVGSAPFLQLIGKPSTGIRIDSALTRRVQDSDGATLVEAIVSVAHASGLQTIAAGVEDAETAAMLTLLGVQRLQGRHIGAPLVREDFEKLLAQDRHAP